jgi:hypothetical protein
MFELSANSTGFGYGMVWYGMEWYAVAKNASPSNQSNVAAWKKTIRLTNA